MVPGLGVNINGARIWVQLGPLSFQPGEFAKIALAIFFAAYLAERRELIAASTWKIGPFRLPEIQYIAPILVAWGFSVLVMVGERDLGSSLLFFTLFVVMMWVATERVELPGDRRSCCSAGAAFVSWQMFGHVQTRVDIWLDPWEDEYGKGFQIVQALYGIGDGGHRRHRSRPRQPRQGARSAERLHLRRDRRGDGSGRCHHRADGVPAADRRRAPHRAAHRPHVRQAARDGLTTIIGVQAFIIIGGVIKVVPLTGITLAVRELRRLVAAVELHPAGAPAAAERRRRPPPRRTAPTTRHPVNAGPPGDSAVATRRERHTGPSPMIARTSRSVS